MLSNVCRNKSQSYWDSLRCETDRLIVRLSAENVNRNYQSKDVIGVCNEKEDMNQPYKYRKSKNSPIHHDQKRREREGEREGSDIAGIN